MQRAGAVVAKIAPAVCRVVLPALAVVPLLASVGTTARAETLEADLKATMEQGFARMVLTFHDLSLLPQYDALSSNGVLRIRFRDEVLTSVDDVPVKLPGYISIARRDPDGSALRFALMQDFRVNTMEAGEKLFIDLLPPNWQGMPPGLPDDVVRELAKRAEEAIRKARALEQARLKGQEEPAVNLAIGSHPTFTRLAFEWNVNFDSAFVRENDMVKVTFNHDANLDLGQLKAHLPPGVVDATAFPDQGKLKFLLRISPDVDIRAFREDQTYVVDVTPPAMPADAINAAFDKALSNEGEGKTGVVNAPGRQISAGEGGGAPAMPPESGAQGETNLDAGMAPSGQTANADDSQAVAASEPAQPGEAAALPEDPAPVGPEGEPARSTVTPTPRTKPDKAGEVADVATPEAAPPVSSPPATAEATQDALPGASGEPTQATSENAEAVADAPAEQQPGPQEAPATPPVAAAAADAGQVADDIPDAIDLTSIRAPQAQEQPEARASPEQPPAGYDDESRRFVAVEARRIGDMVRIVFPFSEEVASSVFRRHESVFLVFDTSDPIDVRGMRSVLADMVETVEVTGASDWQTIRVDLADDALATVGVDGSSWILTIGDTILEPSRPLTLERTVRGDGGTIITVPFQEPGRIHEVRDPFVGDVIKTVTGFGPARGVLKPHRFVEFDALMSAHGVAVVPRADDLVVETAGDKIVLQRPQGLSISNGDLSEGTRILQPVTDRHAPAHVELGKLTASDTKDFLQKVKAMEYRIASAPEGARRVPRMDLSRFYLAHGFAQEALGLMRLAAEDDPTLERDATFSLLMGAAQVLAARPKDALEYLNQPDLLQSPDAAVWRTIAAAEMRDWNMAREGLARARAVVGNYPVFVQTEFNLAAAETMVEINDFGRAGGILSEIDPSLATSRQAGRYDLLRGQIADASGRSREALTAFDVVRRSDERPLSAEATYRALRIRHRDGEISTQEAIDQLSGLATSWRGDETELKTLRFLAQLQAQAGNYREAFEAMQAALQANPAAETARLLQDEMGAVFSNLFLRGGVDKMEPVKALALFYDFREMTPVGRRGDEMVRRLANRLIAMDLLDQAADLLRHQIDHRLKGAARAQVAADLGVVYLMDRKPERALRVLNQTRQAKLPRELERQRNVVEARALTESGRPDLALEIVRNMRGEDVDRLRADTLWAARSWREAGEQIEGLLGGRWADDVPLADQERSDLLRAAIAYSLAEDGFSLSRLATKFASKMSDSPDAKAFQVVTRPVEERGVEFLSVLDSLQAVDSLDVFLSEYQRKYLQPSNPLAEDPRPPEVRPQDQTVDRRPASAPEETAG
uniref:hypothetical protein n=1 Tax=Stappia sp. TaxID=1870903 RepID=UPI003BAC982F